MDEYIKREELYEKAYWHGEHPTVDNPFPDGVDAIDIKDVDAIPAADVAPVRHGRWEDGRCSNCKEEAVSTSFDEPIYDYDWEENLRYSHTETHTEYHLTNYCPNCGAKMDLEEEQHELRRDL